MRRPARRSRERLRALRSTRDRGAPGAQPSALIRPFGDPVAAQQGRRRDALRRFAARGGRAHGPPDGRRARPRPGGHPARRDAPAVRVPRRARRAAGRGREPAHRVVVAGAGDRRGGLPQPAARAPSTSSARCTCASAPATSTGRPITIEASGLEARVIQHEMDHLDGVLILDRATREQRKEALRVLRGGEEHVHDAVGAGDTADAADLVRTVYLGSSVFAVDVLERARRVAARSGAGRHAARPPAGPRPQDRASAGSRGGARARAAGAAGRERERPRGGGRDRRGRARRRRRVRVRAADPRAAAVAVH